MTQRDMDRLANIHPTLVVVLTQVFEEMEKGGTPMFVVEGVRTVQRQQELYAQGRTKPGQIVTYKDGVKFKSNHQLHPDGFGYAVDCAFVPLPTREDPFSRQWPWEQYGLLLEGHSVQWGGRWKMADLPHAELLASPSILTQ